MYLFLIVFKRNILMEGKRMKFGEFMKLRETEVRIMEFVDWLNEESRWREEEDDACEFLKQKFKAYFKRIKKVGGSNSTAPDIEVETMNDTVFNIEVKCARARGGQFALRDTSISFEFSRRNKSVDGEAAKKIVAYINQNYDPFVETGKTGASLEGMPGAPDVFSDWIRERLEAYNVRFILARPDRNDFLIIPVDRFKKSFDVSARCRLKASGSQRLSIKAMNSLLNYLNNDLLPHVKGGETMKAEITTEGLIIHKSGNLQFEYITLNGANYYLSDQGDRYVVKKVSDTANYTVVFSLNLKRNAKGWTEEEFRRYLRNN